VQGVAEPCRIVAIELPGNRFIGPDFADKTLVGRDQRIAVFKPCTEACPATTAASRIRIGFIMA
jgi:hypothetical protein